MAKINYTACAMRPEEVVVCSALDAGDYPQLYSEKVKSILETISEDGLRKKVESTLGIFESGTDGKLAQSSPYRLVVLQEILPKEKVLVIMLRLQAAKNNGLNLPGFYVDCGLNLATSEEGYQVNPVQAEVLAKDLRAVGIELTTPKLIPYSALMREVNAESSNGLVFKLSEQGKANAKSLILNTGDFSWNYLPTNNGLFRACLDRVWLWNAGGGDLLYSNVSGRVVVETTGEASALEYNALKQQSEELLVKQQEERQDLIARLQA